MAVATVPLRVITVLFGAGFGGSYIYNNLDGVRQRIAEHLLGVRGKTHDAGSAGGGGGSSDSMNELSSQMTALSREVARASEKAGAGPVMIIDRNAGKGFLDSLSATGWTIMVVSAGIGGYLAYKRGIRPGDFFWVSRSAFSNTVERMQNGVAKVSGMVANVKKELSGKLKMLEGQLELVRNRLGKKIEKEVGEVKEGIGEVGADVEDVRKAVEGLQGQLGSLDEKMSVASHGIFLLCKVVSGMGNNEVSSGTFDDLKRFTSVADSGRQGLMQVEGTNGNGTAALTLPKMHRSGSSGLGSLLLENQKGMATGETCRKDAERGYHMRRQTTLS
eukprot:Plantae.Rhodophyta-Hildenbrandia_rubra.ctg29066.p1 GENE.Plantae.Rhodophyta-Hildenbrandia_rubra.ctg29066~~Plantae.Rhodophyta-Hildenbrandia_rubra.ctg29066.p1  ORF type:complete len:332 (-),score=74.64 Plantae.Rhodophyta-Hildenbrandia_rubra.ctg29066:737-1732(-)